MNFEDGDVLDKMKTDINLMHTQSENITSKILSLRTEIDKIKLTLPQVSIRCDFLTPI